MPMAYGVDNRHGPVRALPSPQPRSMMTPNMGGTMGTGISVRSIVAAMAAGLICALPRTGTAAELQVYAAGAVQSVMQAVAPEFERASGHKLQFAFGTVGALQNRIVAGEPADVAVLSAPSIADL